MSNHVLCVLDVFSTVSTSQKQVQWKRAIVLLHISFATTSAEPCMLKLASFNGTQNVWLIEVQGTHCSCHVFSSAIRLYTVSCSAFDILLYREYPHKLPISEMEQKGVFIL